MKTFLLLAFLFLLLFFGFKYIDDKYVFVDRAKTDLTIKEMVEKAYFEGQRDAINEDVRIELNSDSIYIWIKSCWDDGTKPIFNPTHLDTKHNIQF